MLLSEIACRAQKTVTVAELEKKARRWSKRLGYPTAASSLTCVTAIPYSYVTARCQEQQLRGSTYRCKVENAGKQVEAEIDVISNRSDPNLYTRRNAFLLIQVRVN